MWWHILIGVGAGLVLLWLALIVTFAVTRPRGQSMTEMLRLLPDVLRLIARLTRDRTLPRGVRWRLGLLAVYLASPIDLIPDFIPVLGYADDAIVVALTLRSVASRAGPEALDRHWPGSPDGLATLHALLRLPEPTQPTGSGSSVEPD
ncbi:MAG: DUF1232 domain-containing protein [Actinomycetota bacterium]|nr:DUF1232 domain-containing protein [Actinomycetota bacterium]